MPPTWLHIPEWKVNALLENGVHFVNIVREISSNLSLSTLTLSSFASFLDRTTPYFVQLQTHSHNINFKVPPYLATYSGQWHTQGFSMGGGGVEK